MIGTQLEKSGWRQGSVVRNSDIRYLVDFIGTPYETSLVLLLASQSCDVANNNIDSDPYIELSIARRITESKGHLTHNKNPRTLHTNIICRTGDGDVFTEGSIELRAFERVAIQKERLEDLLPDSDRILEDRQLKSYVAWLAARYSRPALPTAFNNRVSIADPKNKLRDKAKKSNEQLVGIYIEITPDAEIKDDETYNINLLGLLPAGFNGDTSKSENAIRAYEKTLQEAGMEVSSRIRREDEISIAVIKRFKRLYLDDLSFREKAPHPPETTGII
jgi:hypothetical protein